MEKRNPIVVCLLAFVTCGIYGLIWLVSTKSEMVAKKNACIPTCWLIIIPFVSIWWAWKYAAAVETVTGGKMNGVVAFILLLLLGPIGMAVIQNEFNKVA